VLPKLFWSLDLLELGVVSESSLYEMAAIALAMAVPSQLRGDVATSLEPPDAILDYRLLNGDQVEVHLTELDRLYREDLCGIAERLLGKPVMISPDRRSGVNVNVLEGMGSRYEWHVDSNPLTGLLVLTECGRSSGGRLVFGQDPDNQIFLALSVGQLLLFDARDVPHCVEPLGGPTRRVTAPMNFYVVGDPVVRPDGIDESLYGS
jgi:hypothetical protein